MSTRSRRHHNKNRQAGTNILCSWHGSSQKSPRFGFGLDLVSQSFAVFPGAQTCNPFGLGPLLQKKSKYEAHYRPTLNHDCDV